MRLALLLACTLVACAVQKKQAAMAPMPQQPTQSTGMAPDPHADIERLSKQIDASRDQLALPPPATASCAPQCAATPMAAAVSSKDCHPGQSDTCQQTCTVSDSICSNAQQICNLASQLAGDTWAAQKCEDGKATCDSAHAKCCACTP